MEETLLPFVILKEIVSFLLTEIVIGEMSVNGLSSVTLLSTVSITILFFLISILESKEILKLGSSCPKTLLF